MNKCKKHPKYKAILKPRCDCRACWEMYVEKIGTKKQTYGNKPLVTHGDYEKSSVYDPHANGDRCNN